MSKNAVAGIVTACVLVFSAIGYGIYINISSSAHVTAVKQQTGTASQIAVVQRRDLAPAVRTVLQLEPVWQGDIYSAGDGRIEQLLVRPGDKVAAGMLIAVLDSRELTAQIKQSRGSVQSAQAGLEQAESELQKAELLGRQNAISGVQLEAARYKRDSAEGQLTAAQGSLEALLVKADQLKIYAQRSGVISKVYSDQGSFARTGLALANLADTAQLTALMSVDSASLPSWVPGTAATVTVAGTGFAPARVMAAKGGSGLPAGVMLVELTIDNRQGAFQPGVVGLAEITGTVSAGVLAVPETSIVTKEQQKFVQVLLPDGRLQTRPVQTGFSRDGWTVITAGLTDGDKIAVYGQEEWRQ